ncbi:Volume-regulated anion channel subunit LRRC8E, partial [Frankliniella fusca]
GYFTSSSFIFIVARSSEATATLLDRPETRVDLAGLVFVRLDFDAVASAASSLSRIMINIEDVRIFEGKQPGSVIYHVGDGYYYTGNKKRGVNLYLKCIRYESHNCLGRAVIRKRQGRRPAVFERLSDHRNHDADIHYADEMLLRRNILRRCKDLECTPYQAIVSDERRRFIMEVRSRVTVTKLRVAMRNARMSSFPQPAPRSLQELTALLQNPRYEVLTATLDGEDNLYAGSVTDENGDHHILFASRRQLQLLTKVIWLHGDGTLKVVPAMDGISQLFTIVTTWTHHIVALAWALMSSKTQVAYEAVLTLVKNQLGQNVTRKIVMTDFERPQQAAWESVFPNCDLRGCLFHLVRAYVVEALRLGLRRDLQIPEVRRIFEMYCALPLLPVDDIREGYLVVLQQSRNEGQAVFRICRRFSAYVLRYWVMDQDRLRWMSVHGSVHRTNNASESHNRTLKDRVTVHPNIYIFISKLLQVEHDTVTDVESLRRGEVPVGRARKTSAIRNDRALRRLEEALINPPGPRREAILNFLEAARHRLVNIINDALMQLRPH